MNTSAYIAIIRRASVCAAAVMLALRCAGSLAAGGDGWADLRVPSDRMLGSLSCASASCHGSLEPIQAGGRAAGQEYLHWLGGAAMFQDGRRHYDPRARVQQRHSDPHALAGQRLGEPRFQEVLRRASSLPGEATDPAVYSRCAQCHDPLGLAGITHAEAEDQSLRSDDPRARQGIGCESCHGAARDWLATHYQRGASRESLSELGMIDTKNLLVRSRVCATCHVGSNKNDVNHDLLAAGHPPLRFEMASYQALIDRKHWDDAPRRLAEPDYEVQLWAAGRIASADAALALLESRAQRARATDDAPNDTDKPDSSWPEFAEYNCFSCHQSLRPEIVKLPAATSAGRSRGVPPWQSWNMALAPLAEPADNVLDRLRAAMERSLASDPREIAALAAEARLTLRDRARPLTVAGILQGLAAQDSFPTWERACHELTAIVAIERVIGNDDVRRRARQIGKSLRFVSPEYEWPAVLGNLLPGGQPPPAMSLQEVHQELKDLRRELTHEGQDR